MNKNQKKTLCFILPLVALSLVSCGGETPTSDTSELSIAFAKCGFGEDFLTEWETAYNAAHPDEKIKIKADGDPQMTTSMLPRLQSGKNLPDIFMVLSTNWQASAAKGLFEPIDEVYAAEAPGTGGLTVKDYMAEGLRDFGVVNEHYYAMPWSAGPTGLVYNVKMFEQYGWKVPTTIAELTTLCTAINKDSGGTIAPFAWSGQTAAYWDFLCQNWWSETEGEANWKTFWDFGSADVFQQEGRLNCLQGFYDLICDGGKPKNSIEGASSKTFMQAQMSFINSEAAMIPNGCWLENEVKTSLPTGFEMKLMETPHHPNAKKDSNGKVIRSNLNSVGDFMAVPVRAPHKDLAKKFLTFISGKEANELFTKSAGGLRPFNYKPTEVAGLSNFTMGCAEMYENEINYFKTSSNPMYFLNLVNAWPGYGTPYSRMIQDEETPAEVMANIENYVKTNWERFVTAAGKEI